MTPQRTSIAIVDDHPLLREGLAARIATQCDMQVCGEAEEADEALEMVRRTQPDLIILDLALKRGHGLDLIKRIRAENLTSLILVVSAYEETLFAERALRAGANGYINKQALQSHVIEAIRTVLRGEPCLSAALSKRLVSQALTGKPTVSDAKALTDRELQIFERIGRGKTTREIAAELGVSVHTIESHRENIRTKLGLRNGAELMQQAVQWRLQQP